MKFADALERCTMKENLNVKKGLQAVKNEHHTKIDAANSKKVLYSIDIDSDLTRAGYKPLEKKWDYVIAYEIDRNSDKVYFVETHSAHTGNVSEVIQKAIALRDWAISHAKELWGMKPREIVWIASGPVKIRGHDVALKRLSKLGVRGPVKKLYMQ